MLMQKSSSLASERREQVASRAVPVARKNTGRAILAFASLVLLVVLLAQILHVTGAIRAGFADFRPSLYAYLVWSIALGVSQVMIRGKGSENCGKMAARFPRKLSVTTAAQ